MNMTGVWLAACTSTGEAYPCRCHGYRQCGARCPCAGRLDAEKMPRVCCARRKVETKERAST